MKTIFALIMLAAITQAVRAESLCDIRPGVSIGLGVKVVEFASGNQVHSKMSMREATPDALHEEIVNLQDMGVCEEQIRAQKCFFRVDKVKSKIKSITLIRGNQRWSTWTLKDKKNAENFVKNMKRVGFCS